MAVVYREFDISRKTGHKIFNRYKEMGIGNSTFPIGALYLCRLACSKRLHVRGSKRLAPDQIGRAHV